MNNNEILDLNEIKNKLLLYYSKEELVEYHIEAIDRINKAIEYCEEITNKEIDTSDTDFELGQDFTARDILNILKKEE